MHKALVAFIVSTFLVPSQEAPHATHVSAADIRATLAGTAPDRVSDRQIRMVDAGGYNVGVGVVRRPGTARQGSIGHEKLTEVYYVLQGAGTLVTGGTQIDASAIDPSSATYRELTGPSHTGSGIERGVSRRIQPGDVVIIPAGVAHWFSEVEGTIEYLVVRVDPERLLATK